MKVVCGGGAGTLVVGGGSEVLTAFETSRKAGIRFLQLLYEECAQLSRQERQSELN